MLRTREALLGPGEFYTGKFESKSGAEMWFRLVSRVWRAVGLNPSTNFLNPKTVKKKKIRRCPERVGMITQLRIVHQGDCQGLGLWL